MSDDNRDNGHSHFCLWFVVGSLLWFSISKGCRLDDVEQRLETMQTQQAAEAEERKDDDTR